MFGINLKIIASNIRCLCQTSKPDCGGFYEGVDMDIIIKVIVDEKINTGDIVTRDTDEFGRWHIRGAAATDIPFTVAKFDINKGEIIDWSMDKRSFIRGK